MNRSISENNESSMFITLFIGILDLKTGHLRFCNAGHNPPIVIPASAAPYYLKARIQVFAGIVEDMEYTEEEIEIEKDSLLLLYTDGVTEAENESKKLYGEDKLLQTVAQNDTHQVRDIVDSIIESVTEHVQQAEASDDLTILILHYKSE